MSKQYTLKELAAYVRLFLKKIEDNLYDAKQLSDHPKFNAWMRGTLNRVGDVEDVLDILDCEIENYRFVDL